MSFGDKSIKTALVVAHLDSQPDFLERCLQDKENNCLGVSGWDMDVCPWTVYLVLGSFLPSFFPSDNYFWHPQDYFFSSLIPFLHDDSGDNCV